MDSLTVFGLGAAIGVLVGLYWYFTKCEKCGSLRNFAHETAHFDAHQQRYFVTPYYECAKCGHRKWLREERRGKEFYSRKSM